jgi:tetratricopeptide (TPR) repeat protein
MAGGNIADNNHRMAQLLAFLEKSPNDCFLLHALGLENLKNNNKLEALNLFERVIAIDPSYVGTYYHLGRLLEIMNKKEKAVNVYEEGIKMAQQKGDFHSLGELRSALDILMEDE